MDSNKNIRPEGPKSEQGWKCLNRKLCHFQAQWVFITSLTLNNIITTPWTNKSCLDLPCLRWSDKLCVSVLFFFQKWKLYLFYNCIKFSIIDHAGKILVYKNDFILISGKKGVTNLLRFHVLNKESLIDCLHIPGIRSGFSFSEGCVRPIELTPDV